MKKKHLIATAPIILGGGLAVGLSSQTQNNPDTPEEAQIPFRFASSELSETPDIFPPQGIWKIPKTNFYVHGIPEASSNKEVLEELDKSKQPDYKTEIPGYNEKYDDDLFKNWDSEYREIDTHKGKERIKVIQDYTVKLRASCKTGLKGGTGWFLDYVLPKEGQSYPTKWFVVTNAHVVSYMQFKTSPYGQPLPQPKGEGCLNNGESKEKTLLWLFKERNRDWTSISDESREIEELDPEIWTKESKQRIDSSLMLDASKHQDSEYLYFKEKDVQLFYVPINYLGVNAESLGYQSGEKNYFKDFAVLAVDFKDETTAQLITRDFYNKYDKVKGSQSDKALNLFAEELMARKTSTQMHEEKMNYFVAGYPDDSPNEYRSYGNFSVRNKRANKLSNADWGLYDMRNEHNQPIMGHSNVGKWQDESNDYDTKWNNVPHNLWGYYYTLENTRLGKGVSGALVTDEDGNVMGLSSRKSQERTLVEPIRSKGVYKDGKIIYPRYDLIEGAPGQLSSYKSQVIEYYLSQGESTALSRDRNWNTDTN
ncbi:hypothetical protein MHSWG343_08960 [Candidatus Mycoplasma haematohominis]|uniref:DUF31 domain-containing protein n=1 Tax=Candidatus Mycoplasma haematohominis TaxID=1494318 RepID=A0A478FTX9_9MOLU|nr:hypothetical protein MHSWG343_08960 [Candidatus Mycoplasma haemohominis]